MKLKIKRLPNSDDVLAAVRDNNNYCPCKLEKIPENKCMCKQFLAQETEGDCECGLYTKTLND